MTTALITGITGQDGGYLAEQLLADGVDVIGMIEPGMAAPPTLPPEVALCPASLDDAASIEDLVARTRPDQIYNLAAQSSVADSFGSPLRTLEITGMGAIRMLEAARRHAPGARVLQASSAEMFGDPAESPQTETTPLRPHSPYGIAKVFAHQTVALYRETLGMFCCSAILFNHESPRRPPTFVTRKITRAAARISLGLERELELGNLDARRDWGFAGDHVAALRLMLSADVAADYVVATGETHSLRELLVAAFERVGLDWTEHVRVASNLRRPHDAGQLCGDSSVIRRNLGWRPRMSFVQLVESMVDADLTLARAEAAAAD